MPVLRVKKKQNKNYAKWILRRIRSARIISKEKPHTPDSSRLGEDVQNEIGSVQHPAD